MADYIIALQEGVPLVVAQTTTYALPSRAVWLMSSSAVEVSLDNSNWSLVTASTTGVETAACFVRCTTSTTCTVIVKRI